MLYIRVDKPLFYENYCNYTWQTADKLNNVYECEFNIKYISNLDEKRYVMDIEIPDLDRNVFYFNASEKRNNNSGLSINFSSDNNTDTVENIGMYNLHKVTIRAQAYCINGEEQNINLILNKAIVHFDDQSTQEINLGEINISKFDREAESLVYDSCSSTNTNDGTTETKYLSNAAFTILEARVNPSIETNGLIDITLNNIDVMSDKINGFVISENDIFVVKTKKMSESSNFLFDLNLILTVEDNNGVVKDITLRSFGNLYESYDSLEVLRFIKQK